MHRIVTMHVTAGIGAGPPRVQQKALSSGVGGTSSGAGGTASGGSWAGGGRGRASEAGDNSAAGMAGTMSAGGGRCKGNGASSSKGGLAGATIRANGAAENSEHDSGRTWGSGMVVGSWGASVDGSKGDASDGTSDGDSVKMGACKGFGAGADGVEGKCEAAAGDERAAMARAGWQAVGTGGTGVGDRADSVGGKSGEVLSKTGAGDMSGKEGSGSNGRGADSSRAWSASGASVTALIGMAGACIAAGGHGACRGACAWACSYNGYMSPIAALNPSQVFGSSNRSRVAAKVSQDFSSA